MCGIAGFVNSIPVSEKRSRVTRMMESIAHRGPDDEGDYCDAHVALGFRRLSIIDVVTGHQPLSNEDETVWVVFNGEIYNFRELRQQLEKSGHVFRTRTDTETIVHAYEEWGDSFLDHLSGMFAFALWDQPRRRLVLAVDRVGVKPLYFAENDGSLCFASEAKALFSSGLVPCEADYATLPYHMTFLTAPFPRTMFKGVSKLKPGHLAIFEDGRLQVKEYWDLTVSEDHAAWAHRPFERIASSIGDATRRQMSADVPLGAFLSGGIDSSTICRYLRDHMTAPLETYFIAFKPDDLKNDVLMDETRFADQMADQLESIHHSIYASTDNLPDLLPKLAWHMDEPIGDPAGLTSYLLSMHAKKTLTVLLSGVGGDEVFGGYPRYLALAMHGKFARLPWPIRKSVTGFSHSLPGGAWSLFRNLKKFARSADLGPIDAYLRMLTYFTPEEHHKLFTSEFLAEFGNEDVYQYHHQYLERVKSHSLLNQVQYLDFKTFLPCLNLMYTDKMSMAASIEVRVPFLDDRLVADMFTLPSKMKLNRTIRKYAFKKSMEGSLPHEIIWRKKAGFGSPIHAWIRGKMHDFVQDHLSPSRLREQGIFNPQFVQEILRQELSNRQYNSNHIWQLLTFQLWLDAFVKNDADFTADCRPPFSRN
jgi:asparagine synthase (glutamine-hydrolysing)